MSGNGVKPDVILQVTLMADGQVNFQSTSEDRVINLGLLSIAKGLIQSAPGEKKDDQRIYRV